MTDEIDYISDIESIDEEECNDETELEEENSNIENIYDDLEELSKFEIIDFKEEEKIYSTNKRITKNILTKYEKTRILGIRAQMIASGSLPSIKLPKHRIINAFDIAKLELKEKKIPLLVRRQLPSGQYEDWKIKEFANV
jgi:DNA-directed RNA polymerase I, II, and III subunit RPABC2